MVDLINLKCSREEKEEKSEDKKILWKTKIIHIRQIALSRYWHC